MEQRITVKNEQNLFDLALQATGSIEGVFSIALLNDCGLTDALTAGSQISATVDPIDEDILAYYKKELILPATGNPDALAIEVLEGIGYWTIGVDFTVQ